MDIKNVADVLLIKISTLWGEISFNLAFEMHAANLNNSILSNSRYKYRNYVKLQFSWYHWEYTTNSGAEFHGARQSFDCTRWQ